MEERRQEDLEWLMARNPPASRPIHLPMHDSNHPYHTSNIALHNSAETNMPVNPTNYADFLYDHLLEAEFDGLNLSSTPHQIPHQSAAAAPYGGGLGRVGSIPAGGKIGSIPVGNNSYVDHGSIGNAQFPVSFPTSPYVNNGELQRMRVESALRVQQLGMYAQPQYVTPVDDHVLHGNLHGLNLNNVIHDQELDNLRRQGFVLTNNRNVNNVFHSDLGYAFPNNTGRNKITNFQRRETSLEGFEYDNPSLSMSFHSSRCRQRGQSLSSLEELRSKIFSSLEELRGKIFIVSKDQNGARDLQKILGEGKPEEKEIIFSELKDHIRELMVDQFANYLSQKMFEVSNAEQITELLLSVISDERNLMAICLDMHGY